MPYYLSNPQLRLGTMETMTLRTYPDHPKPGPRTWGRSSTRSDRTAKICIKIRNWGPETIPRSPDFFAPREGKMEVNNVSKTDNLSTINNVPKTNDVDNVSKTDEIELYTVQRAYKNVTLHLDPRVWKIIKSMARKDGGSIGGLVNEALMHWVKWLNKEVESEEAAEMVGLDKAEIQRANKVLDELILERAMNKRKQMVVSYGGKTRRWKGKFPGMLRSGYGKGMGVKLKIVKDGKTGRKKRGGIAEG
jgi:hypothetical protein